MPILFAPLPVTITFALGARGKILWLFFSNTNDSRTAWRAILRWASEPNNSSLLACKRREGLILLAKPARIFTRKIRVTASSIRVMGIVPFSTWVIVFWMNSCQAKGTIIISTPAIMACAHWLSKQPGTWPWPFQSPITKPSKPICCFNTSVNK